MLINKMFLTKIWIICRVCLKQQENMFNLFDDSIHNNIWSLLRDCGGVPVRRNDSLPDKICEACLRRLWKVMYFRQDCQRSHRDLLQKQMESNVVLYEEENSVELFKTSNIPSPIISAEPEISTYIKENKEIALGDAHSASTADNSINEDIKHYCVVTKKSNEEINTGCCKETPIVLLLKLKKDLKTLNAETNIGSKKITRRQTSKPTLNKVVEVDNDDIQLDTKEVKDELDKRKGDGKYPCNECKKTYKTYELLRHHSYVHNRPYECKICNKKFSQNQAFISHTNYHTGIKPYYCRICFETFSDISNRNCHERQRHNETKFKCNSCDKSFRFLTLLQKHSASHKLKKCLICNKDFASVRMVRIHHRRQHLKLLDL